MTFQLDPIWTALAQVSRLSFLAASASPTGWNGIGAGSVTVQRLNKETLIYREQGEWTPTRGNLLRFTNTFR